MRLLGLTSGNFKAKDNPRTFKSSTNTNFIVRRTEGTREGIETEWKPEKRNVSFPWKRRLFVVVLSTRVKVIRFDHVIKFVPRLQKVLYGQYGGGFLFLKRSILKKVSQIIERWNILCILFSARDLFVYRSMVIAGI